MYSIIIPNYNRADLITRAVNSVLNQTFSDFELIIVDDCSTDNSMEVISSLEDERIKIFQLEKNSGAAAARNFGIEHSSGDFISFLDSDDYFEPEFLEISDKILSKSDPMTGFMWTGLRYHLDDKVLEHSWEPKKKESAYVTFLYELRIGTGSGITFKRKVFDQCGTFNEKLKAAEDTEFFLRITRSFDYVYSLKILINIQKTGGDRMSRNYKNLGLAYNIFIGEHLAEIERDKELQKKFYYKLMWLNYNIPDKARARKYFRKIPRAGLNFYLKSCLLFFIYEALNLNAAKKIHNRLAA